jgi:predicted RNA binding protein YcfA (HicA-like mRNA interferase family)
VSAGKLPVISGKQLIRALEKKGWRVERIGGSHHVLEHPDFVPSLSVPLHKELKRGTLNQLLKAADLSRKELRRLLR